MLLQFSAQNHRSLRDKQTLSMVASTDRTDDPHLIPCPAIHEAVLPVVGIYGANASGKSNVLGAMGFMQHAVEDSQRKWKPTGPVPWQPFLLSKTMPASATYEMHFITSGTRYRYGFALAADRVEEEWLHAWPNGKKQIWFERERDKFTFGKKLLGENETIRKLTRTNSLFLSAAAQNNHPWLFPVYLFFSSPSLVLRRNVAGQKYIPFIARALLRVVDHETSGAKDGELTALMNLLRAADTGVRAAYAGPPRYADHVDDVDVAPNDDTERIVCLRHRSGSGLPRTLPLANESDGTLALLHLGAKLFKVLDVGGILLIDELEASLHPSLARRIVQLFQDPKQNPKRAQLVFTTHDTNLLGSIAGDPVLRRDQVWLTEKDDAGATTLYPLTDFHPRKEENLERGYLQGRYGAIPFLGPLVSPEPPRPES